MLLTFATSPSSPPPPIQPVRAVSLINAALTSHLPPVVPAATVATIQLVSTAPAISAGILALVQPPMVRRISPFMPFHVLTTALASSVPPFPMGFSSALITFASMPIVLASTNQRQSSPEPMMAIHQCSATKTVTSNTSPQESVIAILRERLERRDVEFA